MALEAAAWRVLLHPVHCYSLLTASPGQQLRGPTTHPWLIGTCLAHNLQELDVDSDDDDGAVARAESVKDPYVLEFIHSLNLPRKHAGKAAGDSSNAASSSSRRPPVDCSKWATCEHHFPDPSMDHTLAFNTAAWQRRGTYVYVCAWDLTHPVLMQRAFNHPPKRTPVPPCPRCRSVERVTPEEWSKAPRRVIAMDRVHLLYSMRYRCKNCPGKS